MPGVVDREFGGFQIVSEVSCTVIMIMEAIGLFVHGYDESRPPLPPYPESRNANIACITDQGSGNFKTGMEI